MSTARIEKLRAVAPIGSEATRAKFEADRNALVEEIEFMRDSGETPTRIATRLGYANMASLERRLHRCGRRDLAAIFHTPYKDRHLSRRAIPCRAGCGGTCTRSPKIQVCRACCDLYGIGPRMRDLHDIDAVLARILRRAS